MYIFLARIDSISICIFQETELLYRMEMKMATRDLQLVLVGENIHLYVGI